MFWMVLLYYLRIGRGVGEDPCTYPHIHNWKLDQHIIHTSTIQQLDNWKLDQEKKKTKKEEEGTKVSDGREERAPSRSTQGAAARVWGVGERIKGVSILRTERFFRNNEEGGCGCQD